jgi:hypothetical protein
VQPQGCANVKHAAGATHDTVYCVGADGHTPKVVATKPSSVESPGQTAVYQCFSGFDQPVIQCRLSHVGSAYDSNLQLPKCMYILQLSAKVASLLDPCRQIACGQRTACAAPQVHKYVPKYLRLAAGCYPTVLQQNMRCLQSDGQLSTARLALLT